MDSATPRPPRKGGQTLGSAVITLQEIWHDEYRLYASFAATGGGEGWFVEVRPDDLADFAAFRRAAFLQRGVWIRHRCEDEPTARAATKVWVDEVAAAIDRGAKR